MLDEPEIYDMLDLISGERQEAFAFEKALQLHEFKMWILFPDELTPVVSVGIAAIWVLEHLERELGVDFWETDPDETMLHLFKNSDYRSIFNNILNHPLYWTHLVAYASRHDIDKLVNVRRRRSNTVARMMSYRHRAIVHASASERNAASINRSTFFVSKFPGGDNVRRRTMFNRWASMKLSAVWVYASQLDGTDFFPRKFGLPTKDFISLIRRDADDDVTINKVLGYYAHISEGYRELNDDTLVFQIPKRVPRLHCRAPNFTEQELEVMKLYREEFAD